MIKKCPICGQNFTPKRDGQWLCSLECSVKYVDLSHKGIKIKQICSVCGKEFYSLEKAQFCSNECRLEALEQDYEERKKAKPEKKIDNLTKTMDVCKRLGISYAEYQKRKTLKMLEEQNGKEDKG